MNARGGLIAIVSTVALAAVPAAGLPALDGPADAQAAIPPPCHFEPERQVERRVRMSEVHGWKGVSATFRYSIDHSADSYVGAAVQGPGGHWSAGGTDHVTTSHVFGQTATVRGKGNRRVTGIFKFNVIKRAGRDCPPDTPRRFTRALSFEGGMKLGKRGSAPRGLAGRCNKAPGHRKLNPHTGVFGATGRSRTYDRGFTLFGVTLGSSTSFSKSATIGLNNRTRHAVWVCGTNASGAAVPINQAVMLYAGPRAR